MAIAIRLINGTGEFDSFLTIYELAYFTFLLETSCFRRIDGLAWLSQVCGETNCCRHQGPQSASGQY